jgi:hypothetical protein
VLTGGSLCLQTLSIPPQMPSRHWLVLINNGVIFSYGDLVPWTAGLYVVPCTSARDRTLTGCLPEEC